MTMDRNLTLMVKDQIMTFTKLELTDRPLPNRRDAVVLGLITIGIVIAGCRIQFKLYKMLRKQKQNMITRVLRASQYVAMFYPLVLCQMALNNFYYPLSQILGTIFCILVVNTLDPFVRGFFHYQSLAVAFLRFLCIRHDKVVRTLGLKTLTTIVIAWNFLMPAVSVIFMHYPIDGSFQIYNLCVGQYELAYNLKDFRQPRQKGYWPCQNNDTSTWFGYLWQMCCYVSHTSLFLFGSNVIELFLYVQSFRQIVRSTRSVALMIPHQSLVLRKRRNRITIFVTFWAWVVELVANVLLYIALIFLFGDDPFLHEVVMLASTGLNFAVLPFFFVLTDEEVKRAWEKGDYLGAMKAIL